MQIYFATSNKGKVKTIGKALKEYGIEVKHYDIDLPEPKTESLREIARKKVLYAYKRLGKEVMAIDSGFYIKSLNGFPGPFVKAILNMIGINGLLKLIEKKEDAEFRYCLAYIDKTLKEPKYFEVSIKGVLIDKKKGIRRDYYWSELFFIFVPKGKNKTLAQMSEKEYYSWKKEIDRKYLQVFANWLKQKETRMKKNKRKNK